MATSGPKNWETYWKCYSSPKHCVYVCRWLIMCVCICKVYFGCLPQSVVYFLKQDLSLKLEFTYLASRLARKLQISTLSPPSQGWDFKCAFHHAWFICAYWGSTCRSSGKYFTSLSASIYASMLHIFGLSNYVPKFLSLP